MSKQRVYECHMDMFWNCFNQEDWDRAIEVLDRAIEIDPNNPDAYQRRGQSYQRKSRAESDAEERKKYFDKSDADLKKAIELFQKDS